MSDSIPWWAVPVLSGTFALLGVLAANFAAAFNDGRKRRMDDMRRWHDSRLEIYFQYLEEWESVRRKVWRFIHGADPSPISIDDIAELERLGDRIRLISTHAVYRTSNRCYAEVLATLIQISLTYQEAIDAAANVEDEADKDVIMDAAHDEVSQRYETAADSIAKSSVDFIDSVRKELGVPGDTARSDTGNVAAHWIPFLRR